MAEGGGGSHPTPHTWQLNWGIAVGGSRSGRGCGWWTRSMELLGSHWKGMGEEPQL